MDALFPSITSVAIAEMGDKTQLLALFLATRFSSKTAIVLGILFATLLNHLMSAWLGAEAARWIPAQWSQWLIGLSFIAVAIWLLVPDQDDSADNKLLKYSAFWASFTLFFIAEIGDKTQIATVLLGAHYGSVWWVLLGSTLGMMAANVPMVYAGSWVLARINAKLARQLACATFLIMGIVSLFAPFA
ncbi:TMEM165/GDT1 family protein [Marinomonas epiphytica]